MMRLRCRIFGHKLPISGWYGDALYGEVRGGAIDGIGRTHFAIFHTCPRCGEKWRAARFHGTAEIIVAANADAANRSAS